MNFRETPRKFAHFRLIFAFRENEKKNIFVTTLVAHAAHARLGSGQRTIKGWHTAVDQLITFRGFGNTL
jgi:hypothetical protein